MTRFFNFNLRRLAALAAAITFVPTYAQPMNRDPLPYGFSGLVIPAQPQVNQTTERTVELLGNALTQAHTIAQRAEIVRDLGACQLPAASRYLVPALADEDASVRAEAARALSQVIDQSTVPALTAAMKDSSSSVRREVVLAGAALGDSSFAQAGIQDSESGVVIAALKVSTPNDSAEIAARLSSWPSDVKVIALRTLARHKATAQSSSIVSELSGEIPVRVAAIEALGNLGDKAHAQVVLAALNDPHPAVRRAATVALLNVATEAEMRDSAAKMISDPDDTVREAAVRLLMAHPHADGISQLVAQLPSTYQPLRLAARDALASAGKANIGNIPEIAAALLTDPEPRRREDGAYLLGQLSSSLGFEQHVALLQDADLEVVAQAATSLGQIGRSDAGPALLAVIDRTVPDAVSKGTDEASQNDASKSCNAAILAVAKIGYQPALKSITPLIGREIAKSTPVRTAAIWAFGVMGDASDVTTCQRLLTAYSDQYELTNVKFEALKALGNLRYAGAQPALDDIRRKETINSLRWIAHRAYDRIAGSETEYSPLPFTWTADVSRTDLSSSSK